MSSATRRIALDGSELGMSNKAASIEHMLFDSSDWAVPERVARYARYNGSPTRVREGGPAFSMRVARWRLHRTVLHERHANDVIHERTAEEIAADGLDHLLLHLVISGHYEVDTGQGFRQIAENGVVLLDMGKPMRTQARACHLISLSIARENILAALGGMAALHGRVLGEPVVLPLADFLKSLCRCAANMPHTAAASLTQALMALLSAAIDDPLTAGEAAISREGAFDRVRIVIDKCLSDPELGPAMLMERTGLSRATLYRLFQPCGGLIAFITTRRLEAARTRLAAPGDGDTLAAIAADCGFASESHFSRKFMASYGMRPGQYRARISGKQDNGADDPRLSLWFSELR